ncbi:hypothetical protein HUB98_06165 [Paenibacillus barcinonensis]|uniref:Uncharacterized protein n=1 Tax=Paenibacillus barcinonensis TaxID=198119 RepID=A0A2V4VDI9_PAEBA|nr:hypothetical protein [Paenibacillus barcinonensis]PYE51598.1 hypothetical protein DFQ00_102393 [Paenibacillus barcinonensis]QKS55965.1 hypothetical protein HUB98_06165 [Paenibacillus barcinonensis]
MTIESLFDLLEISEKATILKSNILTILKTHEVIDEFYLRLDDDYSELNIHRVLYQFRKLYQSNSIVTDTIYQEFQENPVKTLSDLFNESITASHVEQMKLYGVIFSDLFILWSENKTIRFGVVLGILAKV